MPETRMTPRATYRLQLHAGFTLDDAAAVAPYLRRLGVSHVYLSPILAAAPGSAHGYDVVDPTRVDAERGGEAARRRLVAALRAHGLGCVLDIVPNHMSIADAHNRWWWDVLESGPSSRWAEVFDVDWEEGGSDEILLPVLGDHFGRVVERGELALGRDGARFVVRWFEQAWPLAPRSVGVLLRPPALAVSDRRLAYLADALAALPSPSARDAASRRRRHRDLAVLRELLGEHLAARPDVAHAVDRHLDGVSGDPPSLYEVLAQQRYRLAYWRTSRRELGYRRFFDISTLVGVRAEDPDVFEATHALVLAWVEAGEVDGLRIDHPDGLRDPGGYLRRLRDRAGEGTWIVVEKILHTGERLPAPWPVDGTTGYDFLRSLDALYVDPAAAPALDALWRDLTGDARPFDEVARQRKLDVLADTLGSELQRLIALLARVCARHPRHQDHTHDELRGVLRALLASFPVYRTYARPGLEPARPEDVAVVEQALAGVPALRPEVDPELLDLLRDLLTLRLPGEAEDAFVAALQQVTGPVMAKGVEDTAFYSHARFVVLNEVGGDPSCAGLGAAAFHDLMARRAAELPASMLAASTHDTKRSEDVRARLAVLSEIPEAWAGQVRDWHARHAPLRPEGWPDPAMELLLYQSLVGAWPLTVERATAFAEKAAREAKVHTSWTRQDPAYERAVRSFVEGLLASPAFAADVVALLAVVEPAARVTSLARTLVRLTAPGVPDVYQGCELWDHSLVDPDNRRPVDWALRARLLDALDGATPEAILARADEGLPKLHVHRVALAAREALPEAFAPGAPYRPLPVEGSDRVLAYTRGEAACVVVPCRGTGLEALAEARVHLPEGRWRQALTGDVVEGGPRRAATLWARFPVALLVREDG